MWIEGIGLAAATMTTLAFVPQVIQVWSSRSAKDISMPMYLMFSTGIALWFVYGLFIESFPVTAANGITFILAMMVVVMKVRFDREEKQQLALEDSLSKGSD